MAWLPDDVTERDALLIKLYQDSEGEDNKPSVTETEDYGDIQVTCDDVHLFVTFVKLPEKEMTKRVIKLEVDYLKY